MEATDGIEPRVMAQLEALSLDPARPLLAVDADEVLVHFARHLARFVEGLGYEMRLTEYRLEGAIRDPAADRVLSFAESISLIDRYFETGAAHQAPIPGAAAALARLAPRAQVVVLTNVPRHAREARVARLARLGMPYPLVENAGGKGPALAWMAARTGRPAAFVDDSPGQIASAARHAPQVRRLHFVGSEFVRATMPDCAEAEHRVRDWAEAETVLARLFG